MSKSRLKSRTYWLGLLVAVLGAVQQGFSLVQNLIPPKWYGAILLTIGVLIVIAREVTTMPLDGPAGDASAPGVTHREDDGS